MSDNAAENASGTSESSAKQNISDWVDELCPALGLDPADIDVEELLSLAGVAAHTVVRPAAPVTTYIIGYVAGKAAATGDSSALDAAHNADLLTRKLLAQRSSAEA